MKLAKLSPSCFFKGSSFCQSPVEMLLSEASYIWELLPANIEHSFLQVETNRLTGDVSSAAFLVGEGITVEAGAVVEAGAYLQAPCYIGKGSVVRHGAYIRGQVLVGHGCVVGHATELKNSLLLDGSKAGHFCYIGDSILGSGVNLGAGTKLANLKFKQQSSIRVRYQGKTIDTGLRKLGALLAKDVQTGCNAVLNPGSIVEEGMAIMPGDVF